MTQKNERILRRMKLIDRQIQRNLHRRTDRDRQMTDRHNSTHTNQTETKETVEEKKKRWRKEE